MPVGNYMTFISTITFVLPTFLASTFFTLLAKKLAPKFGFIDTPDADRKRHATPTPVMGGIGMALGLLTGLPITLLLSATARSIWAIHGMFFIAFVVTALMFCCLGAIDDRFGLRPITKLVGQITCAIPFLFFFPAIAEINLFEATLSTSALTPVICLVWIIFLVNAFNLMDGSDGLAGTLAIVTLLSSSVLALSHSNMYGLMLSVSTTGMILGFLVFNLPPAKIFMGDAGSMMIGFIVAVLTLVASVNTENQLSAPVPLLLLGVPFLDTTLAFLRRFLKGKSWRDADREHVHHRLLDRGLSPSELLIALGSVSLLFAAVGVFLGGQQSDVSVLFFATLTFAVLVSTRVIGEVEMSLIKKIFFTADVDNVKYAGAHPQDTIRDLRNESQSNQYLSELLKNKMKNFSESLGVTGLHVCEIECAVVGCMDGKEVQADILLPVAFITESQYSSAKLEEVRELMNRLLLDNKIKVSNEYQDISKRNASIGDSLSKRAA